MFLKRHQKTVLPIIILFVIVPWVSFWFKIESSGFVRLLRYYELFEEDEDILISKIQQKNQERLEKSRFYWGNAALHQRIENSQNPNSNNQRVIKGLSRALSDPKNINHVVICIVTVSRNSDYGDPKYLHQSAAAFHELLSQEGNKQRFSLVICNVDSKSNPEAEMLSQFISVLHKNTSSSKKNGSVKEKEKQDYVFCLKNAQKLGSHVLMVEDDTIPRPAILRVISKIVQTSSLENVAFIKMYHPERLQGYLNPEPQRWVEWICLSCLLSLVYLALTRQVPLSSTRSHSSTFAIPTNQIFLITICFMFLLEMTGRQVVLEFLPEYNLVPAPDCCTPANFFPSFNIPSVIKYLESITCDSKYAKDYALVDMAKDLELKTWYLQPNIVSHIGAVSSIHDGINTNA